jgi:hypothetical protein
MNVNDKLQEGIIFFKNSGRIERLVRKIKVRSSFIKDETAKQELKSFCDQLLKIAPTFRNLESEYQETKSSEERRIIKDKYKFLEEKYHSIIKSINKESFFKAVKIANVSMFVFSILGILTLYLLGNVSPIYEQDPNFMPKIKRTIEVSLKNNPTELLQDTHSILSKI